MTGFIRRDQDMSGKEIKNKIDELKKEFSIDTFCRNERNMQIIAEIAELQEQCGHEGHTFVEGSESTTCPWCGKVIKKS